MGENGLSSQQLGYRQLFTLFEEIASGIETMFAGLRERQDNAGRQSLARREATKESSVKMKELTYARQ